MSTWGDLGRHRRLGRAPDLPVPRWWRRSSWNDVMERRGWGRQLVGGQPGPGVGSAELQANLIVVMVESPDLDHHRLLVGVVLGQDGLPYADHLAHLGY